MHKSYLICEDCSYLSSSNIKTVVTIPDGSTIILGGMLKLNQSKGGKKVPILGDLPLVGGAFRGIANSDIRKRLYIFVKAEIIRSDAIDDKDMDELIHLSERHRQAFEQQEKTYQDYRTWPGIKDKTTPPEKVLEAR